VGCAAPLLLPRGAHLIDCTCQPFSAAGSPGFAAAAFAHLDRTGIWVCMPPEIPCLRSLASNTAGRSWPASRNIAFRSSCTQHTCPARANRPLLCRVPAFAGVQAVDEGSLLFGLSQALKKESSSDSSMGSFS
jgi:LSD1 subclass zinc finger protein